MAYVENDRVNIRHFLGFGATFLQADPRLENAITASQSVADGGGRPDSSTETWIKARIVDLQTIESNLAAIWPTAIATGKQEDATIDPARGIAMLRGEGRRLAFALSRMLGLKSPRADVFSAAPELSTYENPFVAEVG